MLPNSLRVLYLHGFASGPTSRKARFLAERFLELGVDLETPDLAEANFGNLTITAQLACIDNLIGGKPSILIGSSLGGYLAGLYASSHPEVSRLVLLAPAFGFLDLFKARLGTAELARWEATNQLSVYHYGDGVQRNLGFQLIADAANYPLVPDFPQPALILHGEADTVVPITNSIAFERTHSNASLIRLPSDHELGNVLEKVWQETARFIMNAPLAK